MSVRNGPRFQALALKGWPTTEERKAVGKWMLYTPGPGRAPIKRIRLPGGPCAECGAAPMQRFDFRHKGSVDWNEPKRGEEIAFCSQVCWREYWRGV